MSTGAPRFAQHVPTPTREQYYRDPNRAAPPPPARGSRSPVERVLAAAADRPDWMTLAACKGRTDDMFPNDADGVKKAQAICATCPVAEECHVYARKWRSSRMFGVWGGMSARTQSSAYRVPGEHRTSCTQCGVVFMAARHLQKYCSSSCKNRAQRERNSTNPEVVLARRVQTARYNRDRRRKGPAS